MASAETTSTLLDGDVSEWAVGVAYTSTRLHRAGSEVRTDGSVVVRRLASNMLTISVGDCSVGTGTFALVDDRLTDVVLASDLMACDQRVPAAFGAVRELFEMQPRLRVGGNVIVFSAAEIELAMQTDEELASVPAVLPAVTIGTPYQSLRSNIEGVGAGTISFVADSDFAATISIPGCTLHAAIGGAAIGSPGPRDFIGAVDDRSCEPVDDVAARLVSFLNHGPRIEAVDTEMRLIAVTGEQIEFLSSCSC